jgi:hypothetical protein
MSSDNQPRSRRKPLRTYKSPTVDDQIFIPRVVESSASSSSSKCKATKGNKSSSRLMDVKKESGMQTKITIRCRCPQSPPLPLFHPLGKLAMSLPPLDPTLYGLPVLAIPDELEDRHGRRTRNGGGKLAEEDVDSTIVRQDMSAVAAVAARERASPRKRRTGGVNKRKRKDGDDGDASYPAKRTRLPRGQNGGEEETVPELVSNVETVGDETVEKRRSMRSRGAPIPTKRRESTDSSGTNTTGIGDPIHRGTNSQKEQEL